MKPSMIQDPILDFLTRKTSSFKFDVINSTLIILVTFEKL